MGSARWDPSQWDNYSSSTKGKTKEEVFSSRAMPAALDPRQIKVRESVDSEVNPNSTPIIVALDVTGSMGRIPYQLVQGNLSTLMQEMLDRRPVSDPHLMFMGVGDAYFDRAPLQATQFEADIRIAEQLQQIYLEGGGGGNRSESYHLPWYFAALKTKADSIAKRSKKGYLFTIGDEEPPAELLPAHAAAIFGDKIAAPIPSEDILAMAQRSYHVFHIIVEEGSHYRSHGPEVKEKWQALLGQGVILLSDYQRLAEVIVSTIQANEGADRSYVAKSWKGDTSLVVARALKSMTSESDTGLVTL